MIINCSGCGKRYRVNASMPQGIEIKIICNTCRKENKVVCPADNEVKHSSNINEASHPLIPNTDYNASKIEKKPEPVGGALEAPKTTTPPTSFSSKIKEDYKKLTKKKYRFGITVKVTVIMVFAAIIPLLLFWISSYKRLDIQINKDTEALFLESASGLSKQINEWVDKNVRIIYALSKMPAIISMDPARQRPLLKIVQENYPWMYAVITIGPDGISVARNDDKPPKDYHDRIYFQGALEGIQLNWQTIISRTNYKPAIVLSTPIRRKDKIVGVMAVGVNLDTISRQINSWRMGQSGNAFLLDENYKVIAHQIVEHVQKQEIFNNNPLVRKHENGDRGLIQFTGSNGLRSVGVVIKTNKRWLLAIQQNKNEAFENLTKSQRYAVILLSFTILIIIFISWFLGQAITKPIKKMTIAADRISMGDYNVTLNTKIKNEIGDLASAIMRMEDCIRLSLKYIKKKVPTHKSKIKREDKIFSN
jgi:HAMP domain-containing protein